MAKKRVQPRRVPRASEPRMYGDGKPSQQATTAQRPAGPATTPAATLSRGTVPAAAARPMTTRPPVTLTQDYRYVLKDLRRLGILAAGTFAVLVALGLIIR